MEISQQICCGLHLQARTEDEKAGFISLLGKFINKTESFIKVRPLEKDQSFTRERYLEELQSQLSISSGYSSIESLASYYRAQRSNLLPSQALSIIFHLEKTIDNERLLKEGHKEPWKFHHTMQLLDWENSCVVAKQDFFEISPDLPLINISLHSSARNIIRYNLFVKNIRRMQRFYEDILSTYPSFVTEDYCCFVLKSNKDYEIQFSLKRSRHLDIFAVRHSQLVFHLLQKNSFLGRLTSEAIIETCDPEGNELVLVTGSRMTINDCDDNQCLHLQRNDSAKSDESTTLVGDCSLIRTRRKPTNRSNSASGSDSSSNGSISSQDGIVYSGRPIVL